MAQTYADNVKNLQLATSRVKMDEQESADALQSKVKQTFQDKLQDYTSHWSGVEQVGNAITQGQLLFKTGRNLYSKYKKYRNLNSDEKPTPDADENDPGDMYDHVGVEAPDASPPDITGVSNVNPEAGAADSIKQPTSLGKRSMTEIDNPDEPFSYTDAWTPREPIRSEFQKADTSVSGDLDTADDIGSTISKNAMSTASDVAAGTGDAAEAGADLGSFFAADAVADAIPVIGEGAAVVGGLVAIGDGIAHLVDHSHDTPTIKPSALSIPTNLTSKYSDAVPSTDGTTQRAAGSSVF